MEDKQNGLVLAIDYGTQSVRGIIFDKSGNVLCKKSVLLTPPYFSVQNGWAEQSAEVYWEKLCEAIKGLKQEYPTLFSRVVACSVTAVRDSCVCLDKDGKALRPVIVWLDQRKADLYKKQVPWHCRFLFRLVGMSNSAKEQLANSPINWIRVNEPEIWAKTDKFVLFSCYLNLRLSGNCSDSIASTIGHISFNYKKFCWQEPNELTYTLFPVEKDKQCALVETSSLMGYITKEASEATGLEEGLPIISSGSDKGCETIGTGCCTEDMGSLSFGTTATIQLTTPKYFEPIAYMPSYPAVMKDCYNPEVQVYRGFWMISWFKEQFAHEDAVIAKEQGVSVEDILNKKLLDVPVGSDGLLLQPYWSPTLKAPEGKGAIIGFSDIHTKYHIYRAIIEGIGFSLYEGLLQMEKRGKMAIKRLTVSGGGSQSDEICQIMADIFGLPILKTQTYETSGLGAAMTTFVGIGVYRSIDEAVNNMVRYIKTYQPNPQNHALYEHIFRTRYVKMYKQLKPFYIKQYNEQ